VEAVCGTQGQAAGAVLWDKAASEQAKCSKSSLPPPPGTVEETDACFVV